MVTQGLVPQRPGDRVKTDPRDAHKLARLLAGGLLEPIHVPSPELEAARDLVRAREDARLDRMRDRHRLSKFCLRHGRLLPTSAWTVTRRKWLSEQRFEYPAEQLTFDTLSARGRPRRRADRDAGAGDSRDGRAGAVARSGCPAALPARHRHADRARAGRRDRRLRPLPHRGGVDGLRRPGALRALSASTSDRARSRKSATAMRAGSWSRPPDTPAVARVRLRARPPPARPGRRRDRARLALPAASLSALAADGQPRQATPRAHPPRSSGSSWFLPSSRSASPHGCGRTGAARGHPPPRSNHLMRACSGVISEL
jgi:hypothetical protein